MSRTRTAVPAALLAVGVGMFGAVVFPSPASAHVTVNPREANQGGYARLAFRVPTESDTASTTKLEVVFPENDPLASVSTMPVPGWTVQVERKAPAKPVEAHGQQLTQVVSKLTWTATPAAVIKPGEFQEFPVSVGPLPEATDKLIFKALQTYSDGTVARWIEEPVEGQESENPAMVLKLTPAADEAATQPVANAQDEVAGADDSDDSGNTLPVVLGIVGLIAGLAGAAMGALALSRSRKVEPATS